MGTNLYRQRCIDVLLMSFRGSVPIWKLFFIICDDHWLGAYRTNALYSGHIFVRFNDLEDVFT